LRNRDGEEKKGAAGKEGKIRARVSNGRLGGEEMKSLGEGGGIPSYFHEKK